MTAVPLTINRSAAVLPMSRGYFTIVDAVDWEVLGWMSWAADVRPGRVYAKSIVRLPGGVIKNIYLHRLVALPPAGMDVDHANGNTLDNRRSNLRVCTRADNLRNGKAKGGSSPLKGVSFERRSGKWVAQLTKDYRHVHVGTFSSELEAARAYDAAALREFGEFARLNFPHP